MSAPPESAEQLVRGLFDVKQHFALPDGELEFQVAYEPSTGSRFAELKPKVATLGYRPELSGSAEECVLTLRKADQDQKPRSRIPALLLFFTLAALIFSALLQQEVYAELVPDLSPYVSFFAYGTTMAAILGAHELGRRLVARTRDAGRATSYLIPGIPILPPFIPSWGFASTQSDPALNRDRLFDTVVAGPLAMLGLTVLLFAIGTLTAVQSAVPFAQTDLANTTVTINPSLIQLGVNSLLAPFVHAVAPGYVAVSPIADGATVGFIFVFLFSLPLAFYDGGLLANIALSPRGARAAAYLAIFALLAIDTPNYWGVALLALVLVGRPYRTRILDDVSPLSRSRRWLFACMVVVAFLCLPIPHALGPFLLP
ncbi:MAG: hypothetical protein JRN11_06810 [Nitrososphaerota archaeon]|nr:hypothetical protein [Nitrososphaerota archaeon]MDG7014260.1 hypothetical protein [Nitrososphaerota archaeon]MDG7026438.1 hypothetical protein [Nitrososphaerota archaeon]